MVFVIIFQHALLETEAENVRTSISNAVQHIRSFAEEVSETGRRIGSVVTHIEGGYQVLNSDQEGFQRTVQV